MMKKKNKAKKLKNLFSQAVKQSKFQSKKEKSLAAKVALWTLGIVGIAMLPLIIILGISTAMFFHSWMKNDINLEEFW